LIVKEDNLFNPVVMTIRQLLFQSKSTYEKRLKKFTKEINVITMRLLGLKETDTKELAKHHQRGDLSAFVDVDNGKFDETLFRQKLFQAINLANQHYKQKVAKDEEITLSREARMLGEVCNLIPEGKTQQEKLGYFGLKFGAGLERIRKVLQTDLNVKNGKIRGFDWRMKVEIDIPKCDQGAEESKKKRKRIKKKKQQKPKVSESEKAAKAAIVQRARGDWKKWRSTSETYKEEEPTAQQLAEFCRNKDRKDNYKGVGFSDIKQFLR